MAILKGFFGKKSKPKKAVKKNVIRQKPKKVVKHMKAKPVKKIVIKKKVFVKPVAKPVVKQEIKPAVKLMPIDKIPDEKAFELLKNAKIPVANYGFCKNDKDVLEAFKKIKAPVVMKISGMKIAHKTEFGGIAKDINSEAQAIETFKRLMKIRGTEKILMQKQVSGVEVIVGAKNDPAFGHVISVGLGGIYVEILKDVAFRIAPLTSESAVAMVKELKGYEILAGGRTGKPINMNALYDVLVKVSRLAVSNEVKEMDINPLFCSSEGCIVADVRISKL